MEAAQLTQAGSGVCDRRGYGADSDHNPWDGVTKDFILNDVGPRHGFASWPHKVNYNSAVVRAQHPRATPEKSVGSQIAPTLFGPEGTLARGLLQAKWVASPLPGKPAITSSPSVRVSTPRSPDAAYPRRAIGTSGW